jgi:hypothetical protein
MRRAALVLSTILSIAGTAFATPREGFPSPGSIAELPAGDAPVPLLVLLHGDAQPPRVLFEAWPAAASARSVALVALACPKHAGCKGSFWQWDGDPAWLDGELAALEKERPVDRGRTWAAGWSGGASWMGFRMQAFAARFAALVHWGGGIPPADPACGRDVPAYFLVGDANPLHGLAVRLRDAHERCGHEVLWDLVRGADHAGEQRALSRAKADAILAWLMAHPRTAPDLSAAAPAPPPPAPPATTPSTPAAPAATAASAPPSTRCACQAAPLALLALAFAQRRQRGGGGRSTPVAGSGSH